MKRFFGLILVGGLFLSVTLATAQTVDKAIKYRQSAFAIMGWNFGAIVDMIKGKREFKEAEFVRRASVVSYMSRIPMEGFAPGSDQGNTKAKAEIWSNSDDFKALMKQLQTEADALEKVSRDGDFDAAKKQVVAVGKACKSCHDKYRNK